MKISLILFIILLGMYFQVCITIEINNFVNNFEDKLIKTSNSIIENEPSIQTLFPKPTYLIINKNNTHK